MNPRWVICSYKPRSGLEGSFILALQQHHEVLKKEGLITDATPLVLRSSVDGAYLELFEWRSDEAAERAHTIQSVVSVWGELRLLAETLTLGSLGCAVETFPHFDAISSSANSIDC